MSKDPLQNKDTEKGLCSDLYMVTLCTSDIEAIKKFYVEGMGMRLDGPFKVSKHIQDAQNVLWGIEEEVHYQYYHLHRATVPELIQIRLLVMDNDTPLIHKSYSSREIGSFSIGFPNGDQKALDTKLRGMGIKAMAPLQVDEIARPDGTTYPYLETIFKGPDNVHCVGIERGGGMPQLAPIDEESLLGGPGYSAFVTDRSDQELAFYTDVLGMELRADRYWESAEDGALGIPAGVQFRFSLVYAPGTSKNHMLFLDYQDGIFEQPSAPSRVPNRGLGMWTFETYDMDQVIKKAKEMGIEIIAENTVVTDSIIGEATFCTMLTPTGLLIELFQR